MRIRSTIAATGVAVMLFASACSGSSGSTQPTPVSDTGQSSTTQNATTVPASSTPATLPTTSTTVPAPATTLPAPQTTPAGAVDPNAPEVVEPGDIPDNQVFIPFASADGDLHGQGPGRLGSHRDGRRGDLHRQLQLDRTPVVDGGDGSDGGHVSATGLSDVSSDPTFTLIDVTAVTRKAGTGVLATYEIGSAPNPVTGKKALLAVERYVFFHNGTVVTMTLSGAKGADNVDPWRIVSDSLTWT